MGKGVPGDSAATRGLLNRVSAAYNSLGKMEKERVAQRIHPPTPSVCPTARKTLPGSLCVFFCLFLGFSFWFCFFVVVLSIKAHLEGTNTLQGCQGWALNSPQKALLQVTQWELVALTPPQTQRHRGEQRPQPGLRGAVVFKCPQGREKKKREGKKIPGNKQNKSSSPSQNREKIARDLGREAVYYSRGICCQFRQLDNFPFSAHK